MRRLWVCLLVCLWPQAASAVTYYISTSGDDVANDCTEAQSTSTPKRTWIGLVGTDASPVCTISPGDTIYFRGGDYIDIDSSTSKMPSGSLAGGYVTISAYQVNGVYETVRLLTTTNRGVAIRGTSSYLIFNQLILDGSAATGGGNFSFGNYGAHHIKWIGGQIKNTPISCVEGGIYKLGASNSTDIVISGVEVFNCGSTKFDHGLYFLAQDAIIENSNIHNNPGYGIHMYSLEAGVSGSNTIIKNNRIHHNNNDEEPQSADILVRNAGTTGVQIYNNLIYSTSGGDGQAIVLVSNSTKIYNNTIYDHPDGPAIDVYSSGNYIRNNILYLNEATITVNPGGSATSSNNLTTDPDFVDADNYDFDIEATSDAIGTGLNLSTDLSPPENDVAWTADMIGTPKGAVWDIGALEFIDPGGVDPEDPPAECSAGFAGTIQPVACAASRADTTTFATTAAVSTTGASIHVILCGWDPMSASATVTASDSVGNAYTALTASSTGFAKTQFFYKLSPTTSTDLTATCSSGGSVSYPYVAFLALRLTATSPIDQQNGSTATQSTTSLQPGSITPTENNEVVLVGITISGGCSDFMVNSSFQTLVSVECGTEETQGGGFFYIGQTTAGAVNPTVSWTSPAGDEDIAMRVVSIKAISEEASPPASTNVNRLRGR